MKEAGLTFGSTDVAPIAGLEGNKMFYKLKKNLRNFQKALYFGG